MTHVGAENVYCYRVGSTDCFKVGRTKHDPEKRKRGFSTGSPVKFELVRTVPTDDAARLESYVHQLLDPHRTENGEFFKVTQQQLDEAVDTALAFVTESAPLLAESKKLCKKKPNGTTVDAPQEMKDIYCQLRAAYRERYFLAKRIESLQCNVQVAIGENSGMAGVASWGWVEHWMIDIDRLKRERPKLYDKYKRDSSSRKFCLERFDLTTLD